MLILFTLLNKILGAFGFMVCRKKNEEVDFDDIFLEISKNRKLVDLERISSSSNQIYGMIPNRIGEELFTLAYMQNLRGDIVEIGSWQGKSTYFLGLAAKLSENGKVWAIDHFLGNLGKEHYYVVNNEDLSDLESGFRENMNNANIGDVVNLLNLPSDVACNYIKDGSVRLIFIDGDHTERGLLQDLLLFKPKLKDGGIIIFDDYDKVSFPGVVKVVNEFIKMENPKRSYLLGRNIVLEL